MNFSELSSHCYAPYSKQASVAVVESKSGAYFPGVRVENASYPLTISAVQNALFCCLSEGHEPATLFVECHTSPEITLFWEKLYSLKVAPLKPTDEYPFSAIAQPVENIKATLLSLLERAINDESGFPVAALVKTEKGFITGVNIEMSIWNRGLCAERVALAKAVSCSAKKFQKLYICTNKGNYGSPCGACRQVILEHLPHQPVHLYQPDGTQTVLFSSDLLPYSFQFLTAEVKRER
jgi:homotetrameric cytidine deaminase